MLQLFVYAVLCFRVTVHLEIRQLLIDQPPLHHRYTTVHETYLVLSTLLMSLIPIYHSLCCTAVHLAGLHPNWLTVVSPLHVLTPEQKAVQSSY